MKASQKKEIEDTERKIEDARRRIEALDEKVKELEIVKEVRLIELKKKTEQLLTS